MTALRTQDDAERFAIQGSCDDAALVPGNNHAGFNGPIKVLPLHGLTEEIPSRRIGRLEHRRAISVPRGK